MIHGAGISAVSVGKFSAAMDRRGARFLERLFIRSEIEYCSGKREPARHFAGRFAAKASFMKAFGRPIRFKGIEVRRGPGGQPSIWAEGLGNLSVALSIAHDGDLAIAQTIIEKR